MTTNHNEQGVCMNNEETVRVLEGMRKEIVDYGIIDEGENTIEIIDHAITCVKRESEKNAIVIDFNSMAKSIAKKNLEISRLKEEIARLKAVLVKAGGGIDKANEIIDKLQENAELREENNKLHTYGDIYKEDYHDMKDERDELRKRLEGLQTKGE